jgi:hypothetical protein
MASEQGASAHFMMLAAQVRALEQAIYAVGLKGDGVELTQHLERLRYRALATA